MGMCEKELLAYKLKEAFCNKTCCDDCCDICLVDCCKRKKNCSYCDCCVNPMEYLLQQFENGDNIDVYVGFGMDILNAVFLGVYKGILTVRDEISNDILNIPICKIQAIGLPPGQEDIQDVEFLENQCKECEGYCKCCESPIRNQLGRLLGHTVAIICGLAVYEGVVYAVHDGIVILENAGEYIAISTCKIDLIDVINALNGITGKGNLKRKISECLQTKLN